MASRLRASSSDLKYNIVWAWGFFIRFLPIRIGTSAALDSAVAALLMNHADYCRRSSHDNITSSHHHHRVPHETVAQYNIGLARLKRDLNDPRLCSQVETLLTVMVLSVVQGCIEGPISAWSSAHSAGALQMMRLRGWPTRGRNDLETHLFHQLRHVIINNSLINPAVDLNDVDYREIVKAYTSGSGLELSLIYCWLEVSELMSQTRLTLARGARTDVERIRAYNLNGNLSHLETAFRERLYTFDPSNKAAASDNPNPWPEYAFHQTIYSSILSLRSFLLCLHRALNPQDTAIDEVASHLCAAALQLTQEAKVYLPLGSLWTVSMLMVAWCATTQLEERQMMEDAILDYRTQMSGSVGHVPMADMKWMERRLKFQGDESVEAANSRAPGELRSAYRLEHTLSSASLRVGHVGSNSAGPK